MSAVIGRLAIDLDAEQRVLLGEEAAHVNCLLVILNLIGLDLRIQIDDRVRAGLAVVKPCSITIYLLTSLILRGIIQI